MKNSQGRLKAIKASIYVLTIALGIFTVIAGGYDDSPGLQLIGVVVIAGSGIALWRNRAGAQQ